MNPMIPLDTILREATSSQFRDLVTRPTGAAVRDRVLVELGVQPRTQALLDFSHIGLVDFSCADEVVAKLITAIRGLPVGRVVLVGVREDQAEAIDHALERHGLLIVALEAESNRPLLLGQAPMDWQAAFNELADPEGARDPDGIANRLGWPTARVRLALDGLVSGGCVVAAANAHYDLGPLS